jgi:hypothetical protein
MSITHHASDVNIPDAKLRALQAVDLKGLETGRAGDGEGVPAKNLQSPTLEIQGKRRAVDGRCGIPAL